MMLPQERLYESCSTDPCFPTLHVNCLAKCWSTKKSRFLLQLHLGSSQNFQPNFRLKNRTAKHNYPSPDFFNLGFINFPGQLPVKKWPKSKNLGIPLEQRIYSNNDLHRVFQNRGTPFNPKVDWRYTHDDGTGGVWLAGA